MSEVRFDTRDDACRRIEALTTARIGTPVRGVPAWSFDATGTRDKLAAGAQAVQPAGDAVGTSENLEPPATGEAFERAWLRACGTSAQRVAFLTEVCDPDTLARIFRVEIKSTLLKSIIESIHDVVSSDGTPDAPRVLGALDGLTRAGRFALTVSSSPPRANPLGCLTPNRLRDSNPVVCAPSFPFLSFPSLSFPSFPLGPPTILLQAKFMGSKHKAMLRDALRALRGAAGSGAAVVHAAAIEKAFGLA